MKRGQVIGYVGMTGYAFELNASKGRIRVKVTCKDACRLSGTLTVTSAMRGVFHKDSRTRAEFLELIHYRGGHQTALRHGQVASADSDHE